MKTVLISGGSGLIGTHLAKKLRERGYNVAILSRNKKHNPEAIVYKWNPAAGTIEKEAILNADYIIHLAGENIFEGKWTNERKQAIIDSRVKTARLIFDKMIEYNARPSAFISASAVGYYGAVTSEQIFSETDPPANDFLGEVCRLWEEAADRFSTAGIRTVKIRTSPALSHDGGVLSKMIVPVRFGLGAALGSGNQYFPWIHIDDLCGIYIKAIEDETMQGSFNAVAPEHVTNEQITQAIAHALKKPFWLPNIPSWFLKLIFGEKAIMMLNGSRVSSEKIGQAGFVFQYPELRSALNSLLSSR